MDSKDLETIKAEFEAINLSYRTTFSFQGRLELIERVKKLIAAISAGTAKDQEQEDRIASRGA